MLQLAPDIFVDMAMLVCNEEDTFETFRIKTSLTVPETNAILVISAAQTCRPLTCRQTFYYPIGWEKG